MKKSIPFLVIALSILTSCNNSNPDVTSNRDIVVLSPPGITSASMPSRSAG